MAVFICFDVLPLSCKYHMGKSSNLLCGEGQLTF